MSGSVYAIAAVVLASGVCGARGDEPANTTSTPTAVSSASKTDAPKHAAATSVPAGSVAPEAAPKIVVHANTQPVQASDARVELGGMKISMSQWASGANENANGNAVTSSVMPPSAVATNGAITIPSNTVGPGEPYWRVQERAAAEHRLADARVRHAEAEAERATRDAGRDRGYVFFGNTHLRDSWHARGSGLRGPVTTTTTYSDQLGSTAQRAFSEAAYPRLNGTTEARDAIVRQFGRDAAPPIVRVQNDVDAIHRKANRESEK